MDKFKHKRNNKDTEPPVYIIWPERRWVSADSIRTWYSEAVDSGAISVEYLDATELPVMVSALSDAGILTAGRPK